MMENLKILSALPENPQLLAPVALIGWLAWRWLRFRRVRSQIPELLKSGGVIVDVRSPEEFASGSGPGSINIPLGDLERDAARLDPRKPVVVCCASGTRSALAAALLRRKGFELVFNGGPWQNTRL